MTFDWLGLIRDLFVLAYLVVLRIGVPILLTYLLGVWLQKVLRESDAAAARQARDGAEGNGVHCWEIKGCSSAARAACPAARHPEFVNATSPRSMVRRASQRATLSAKRRLPRSVCAIPLVPQLSLLVPGLVVNMPASASTTTRPRPCSRATA